MEAVEPRRGLLEALRRLQGEGFPDALRSRATEKLSLSSFTFSHELARAMLAEQIYRALATLAGHPYAK